jgi:hypothetical protein
MVFNTTGLGIGTDDPKGKINSDVGNTSTVGAFSSSGLNITSTSGATNNIYQIGFGYASGATNAPASIYALTTSNAGYNKNAICFATRDVTTDTVPTERMRIDSSGNLLVGRTSTGSSAISGTEVHSDGYTQITRSAASTNPTLHVGKLTNDGEIVRFSKDGSSVGSISSKAGTNIIVGTGNCALSFQTGTVRPRTTSDGTSDGVNDLGTADSRFKDLYLSGGVYLGGTGSANHLDDYEEGTWTPTLEGATSGSATYTANNGAYVKIGRFVHCIGMMNIDSTSAISGTSLIKGLPFAMADVLAGTGNDAVGTMANINFLSTSVGTVIAQGNQGLNGFELRYWAAGGGTGTTNLDGSDLSSTGSCRFDLRYYTTA